MIPQNREKVKSRPSFIHIKKPKIRHFSRGFRQFIICSRLLFCNPKIPTSGHRNAKCPTQFEQKVKNAGRISNHLHLVQKINQIVYILSLLNLLFSHNLHSFFAFPTPHDRTWSQDWHVHCAQFKALIFYIWANCTKFVFHGFFTPVWL